ncbi:hypothetical protein [Staphylococcus haemolyticus]|uniref:hypothetical protein n=1 Tax=Staphylococcus haemolyticus TaxID=1283 RepID=UPI00069F7129|nr:hypothetical protein [Staphylococcus haemolyticus]
MTVTLSQKSYDALLDDLERLRKRNIDLEEKLNKEIKLSYEIEGNLYDVSKERDELINDIADIKRKAEAFDEIKRTLNKKIPKLKVLTEEYKLKWQREGSSWVLTDYYKQIGGLEQLTQVINFIEELERGSDE